MRAELLGPLALAAMAIALAPTRADAYLNPDTGSMLLQALLGGFAGLAVLLRLFWGRLAGLFGRRGKGAEGPGDRR